MAHGSVFVFLVCLGYVVPARAVIPSSVYIAFISQKKNIQEKLAVESAIREVNSDPDLLNATTLKLVPEVNVTTDLNYAVNLTTYDAAVMLMDSKPAPLHELVCALIDIPLVTTYSSHANETKIKHGLSLAPSRDDVDMAIVDIIEKHKWTSVLALFDVRWSDQVGDFHHHLPKDIEIEDQEMVLDYQGKLFDTTMADLTKINNKLVEVIVLFCDAKYVSIVMEQVHCSCSRIVERAHNWIIVDMLPSFKMTVEKHQIVIGLTPMIKDNKHTQQLMTDLSANKTSISNSSYLMFDSVLALAHGLDDVIKKNRWITNTHAHNVEKAPNGMSMLASMKKVKIDGTTGDVHFNTEGERDGMLFDIMNLRHGEFVKVGDWNVSRSPRLVIGGLKQNKQQVEVIPISRLNRKLIVVIVEDSPFIIKSVDSATGKAKWSGFSIDLIDEISRLLSFKYEIVEAPDGKYGGKQADGTYNGIVGELTKRHGDLSVSPLTINSGRVQYLSFSKPFIQFTMDLVTLKAAPVGADILAFMMPYSIPVWLMTLVCLAFVTVMLTLVNHYSPFGHRLGNNECDGSEFNLFNSFWFSLACMLQQGGDNTPKCLSGRVLVGCFWFCIVIWVSTYTANLAAFFQYRYGGQIVGTLQEVVDGDFNLHILSDTALEELFKVADYHIYKQLYERMVQRKLFLNTTSQGYEQVRLSRKSIYMEENPFSQYYVMRKPCDLDTAKGFMGAQGYGIAMPKDSEYAANISVAVLKLQETGMLGELRRKWWDYKSQCRPNTNQKSHTDRLALLNMAGVYIVIGVGSLIGVIAMLSEVWWYKKGEEVKSKMRQCLPGKHGNKVQAFEADT